MKAPTAVSEAFRRAAEIARSHTTETLIRGTPDDVIDAYADGLERGYRDAVEQISESLQAEADKT